MSVTMKPPDARPDESRLVSAAKLTIAWQPSAAPVAVTASAISACTNSCGTPSSRAKFPKFVSRSSTTASSPAATRRFTKSLPRKPAPPGTRTRTPRPYRSAPAHSIWSASGRPPSNPHASACAIPHPRTRSRSSSSRSQKEVEAMPDPPGGVRILGEIVPAVTEERGDIERPLASERLRVDREPSALRAEDVPAVEILVQEDVVLDCGWRSREELDRLVQERLLERPARRCPGHRQLGRPARSFSCEGPEHTGRSRLPELRKHVCGHLVRSTLLDLPELRPGKAALDEQRAAFIVPREKAHRPGAVPARESLRLVRALRLGDVALGPGGQAAPPPRRHDQRDVRWLEGRPELEPPLSRKLGGESRQARAALRATPLVSR